MKPCRAHDHCDTFFESGKSNYLYRNDGFRNDYLYTISDCKCDSQLRECLERLDFWVANLVLRLYAFTNQKCLINVCQLSSTLYPLDNSAAEKKKLLNHYCYANIFEKSNCIKGMNIASIIWLILSCIMATAKADPLQFNDKFQLQRIDDTNGIYFEKNSCD